MTTVVDSTPTRLVIRGGSVLSLETGARCRPGVDVLVESGKIQAVSPGIPAEDAAVIDATGMVVMPGFVDSHRHLWQGLFRNGFPDLSLKEYFAAFSRQYGPHFAPEDVYASTYLSAIGALHSGTTTVLDWASIQNSVEHTQAGIQALQDSGIRAVFGYANPALGHPRFWEPGSHRYPAGILEVRRDLVPGDDGIITLAVGSVGGPAERLTGIWQAAREANCMISIHVGVANHNRGIVAQMFREGMLGPDVNYVHCCNLVDDEWRMIADSGGSVSISPWVEMTMGIGIPPVQQALDAGIRPSLGVDVETSAPNDMFAQMQIALAVQRSAIWERVTAGESDVPPPIGARDAIEFATTDGARALRLDDRIGTLTPGKRADIIILRTESPTIAPIGSIEGAVAMAMHGGDVDTVIVDGRIVKRSGTLVGDGSSRAVRLAEQALERIQAKVSG